MELPKRGGGGRECSVAIGHNMLLQKAHSIRTLKCIILRGNYRSTCSYKLFPFEANGFEVFFHCLIKAKLLKAEEHVYTSANNTHCISHIQPHNIKFTKHMYIHVYKSTIIIIIIL